MITRRFLSIRPQADLVQQSLAADDGDSVLLKQSFPAELEC